MISLLISFRFPFYRFPAAFMTAVSFTYILMAQEGFRLNQTVSYIAGAVTAFVLFTIYLIALIRKNKIRSEEKRK